MLNVHFQAGQEVETLMTLGFEDSGKINYCHAPNMCMKTNCSVGLLCVSFCNVIFFEQSDQVAGDKALEKGMCIVSNF